MVTICVVAGTAAVIGPTVYLAADSQNADAAAAVKASATKQGSVPTHHTPRTAGSGCNRWRRGPQSDLPIRRHRTPRS